MRQAILKAWLFPDRVLGYLLLRAQQRVTLGTDSFGCVHAVLYFGIDYWRRYACVAQRIRRLDGIGTVLDVGGSGGAVREFLDASHYSLCVLDISMHALRSSRDHRLALVCGDGCCLPFGDDTFDVVVSVDSLEHVADSRKAIYCHELKRVARRYVIIHCPADSYDGQFQGTACDVKFLEWHRRRFKKDEPNTLQHLNSGLPKVDELLRLFPEAQIMGRQNTDVWFKYMTVGRMPYIRFFTGLLYKVLWQRKDDVPPYHACLLVWEKR